MRHHRKAFARIAGGLSLLLLASGCVDPEFRTAVGSFATATQEAVEQQNTAIDGLLARERERYLDEIAGRRARLEPSDGCSVFDPLGEESPCTVIEQTAPGDAAALRVTSDRVVNIRAASGALVAYAQGLAALAADSSDDQAALTERMSEFASSAGGVNDAIRRLVGADARNLGEPLGALSAVIAQAVNLYLAQRREAVLRDLILRADPQVAVAAQRLDEIDRLLLLSGSGIVYRRLEDASARLDRLITERPDDLDAIRAAQAEVIDAAELFNRLRAAPRPFAMIGAAHTELRDAAASGASPEAILDAVLAVADLVVAAEEHLPEIARLAEGGTDDGH